MIVIRLQNTLKPQKLTFSCYYTLIYIKIYGSGKKKFFVAHPLFAIFASENWRRPVTPIKPPRNTPFGVFNPMPI